MDVLKNSKINDAGKGKQNQVDKRKINPKLSINDENEEKDGDAEVIQILGGVDAEKKRLAKESNVRKYGLKWIRGKKFVMKNIYIKIYKL